MTVTSEAPAAIDFETVVARWAKRQAREVGEDVLDEGQVRELADTLRQYVGDVSVHTSGSDDVARKRDELAVLAEQLRVDLADKRAELGVKQETVDALRGDMRELREQLATITAERDEAVQGSVRLADELAAAQQHHCLYPLEGPDRLPGPCATCGQEFPQPASAPHPSTPAAAEPNTWQELFDQIRKEWPRR